MSAKHCGPKSLAVKCWDTNPRQLDMSEYMEKFNVSRLSAPPGYVATRKGPVDRKGAPQPLSVVCLTGSRKLTQTS
ncbi:MAG: hypothetical protein Ct9H300mP32_2540 [Verrucomicrobiota bacterium]|nr:MAG: hypothetical protein Ct9H300mP32_2540 [Verrucomicrobiota bacterium]